MILINNIPTDNNLSWCLYEHHFMGERILIGRCRLAELFTMADARANARWCEVVNNRPIMIFVTKMGTRLEMVKEFHHIIRICTRNNTVPICNRITPVKPGEIRLPLVTDDGREFATQAEAALALGVSESRVSQHLARRPGYATLRGVTLRRRR